jgi:hypothetical protein
MALGIGSIEMQGHQHTGWIAEGVFRPRKLTSPLNGSCAYAPIHPFASIMATTHGFLGTPQAKDGRYRPHRPVDPLIPDDERIAHEYFASQFTTLRERGTMIVDPKAPDGKSLLR